MKLPLFLLAISAVSLALAPIIGLRYGYDTTTAIEAVIGFVILLAVAGFFWFNDRRSGGGNSEEWVQRAIQVGLVLGLLWVVEISINNFIAPPVPARDVIDNVFWALIALSIFVLAILCAYQTRSMLRGIQAGTWSGLVSGLMACCMGLLVIVLAMPYVTRDPSNIAEWAERAASSGAPSMEAYFAFETFAGAFLHLIVLGIVMGGLLGIIGGGIGRMLRQGVVLFRHQG